ncbi:MAG TPA: hypothetical protein DEP05_04185 [Betaproteobacteria bacterium]|nr:hypothetical protein [Betaproteobacteria bacterium]
MTKSKVVLLSILVVSLYGCASGAKFGNMAYTESIGMKYDKALKHDVGLSTVAGGEQTNPLWTSQISNEAFKKAVEMSLSSQGLLSQNGRYQLKVKLAEIDQPMFGLDFTVTTHVNYILMDTKTNKVIFNDTIVSPYTASVGEAFLAVKRLRLANEGSAKQNIEDLLKKLSSLHISTGEVNLAK